MKSENKETGASNPGALPTRGPIPKPTARLHKRNVFLFIGALSLVLGYATFSGLSGPANQGPDALKALRPATPADAVKNLPNDYGAIKRPAVLGPPLPGELGEVKLSQGKPGMSDLEKLLEQLKVERLKKLMQARESDISFASLKTQDIGRGNSGGPALPGLSSARAALGMPGQDVQKSSRDDDNRQDDKEQFLSEKRNEDEVLPERLTEPISKYQLMAGTLLPALLLTGINSDLPGQILGQISQNVFDSVSGNHLLIPQGTKLLGEYDSRISYGQERVLVVWTRLVLPNGNSILLEGMPGVDLSGYAGLTDQVNNHFGRLIKGVVFTSLLGAAAQTSHGSNRLNPSFSELAVQGGADNLNQAGQQITRKNLQIQPTLEIRPGFRVNVFVTKDIVLAPYETQ